MSTEQLYEYFKEQFDMTGDINGWCRFSDPFDRKKDKATAVNFIHDRVVSWRMGFRGTIKQFLKSRKNIKIGKFTGKIFDKSSLVRKPKYTTSNLVLPNEWKPLDIYNDRVYEYLVEDRQLDICRLMNKSFGYCLTGYYASRIIVPFNIKGKIEYWQARTFSKYDDKRYRFPKQDMYSLSYSRSNIWYNQDVLLNEYIDRLYLVEGWSDAETFPESYHVMASGGSIITTDQFNIIYNAIESIGEIIIICDRGFYEYQVKQFAHLIDTIPVKVVSIDSVVDGKDVNEIVNDYGFETIMELIDKTDYLTMDDFFKTFTYNI